MKICLISGNLGFIGSHLADYLIERGHKVIGIDNLLTGDTKNGNPKVIQYIEDICHKEMLNVIFKVHSPDWVFHLAANARTQRSVDEPLLNNEINITGTLNMLLCAKENNVKRFVFASSCILNAPNTPYYVSKLAGEEYTKVFHKIYNLSTISLRYSNVYGSLRQSEKGPSINALASLRKSKKETGRIWITGDGTQERDWSHINDVIRANLLAIESNKNGVFDICTGVHTSMNEIATCFDCPIDYIDPRPGDAQHLGFQDPRPAQIAFRYKAKIELNYESLKPYLE